MPNLRSGKSRPIPTATGQMPALMQDASRDLSRWLANRPGARMHAVEAAKTIAPKLEAVGPLRTPLSQGEIAYLYGSACYERKAGRADGRQFTELHEHERAYWIAYAAACGSTPATRSAERESSREAMPPGRAVLPMALIQHLQDLAELVAITNASGRDASFLLAVQRLVMAARSAGQQAQSFNG